MRFSQKQQRVISHGVSGSTAMVCVGAARSGKTFAIKCGFAARLLTLPEPHNHILLASSVDVAWRNFGEELISLVKQYGGRAELDRRFGTTVLVHGEATQSVVLIGASDERAMRRIMGLGIDSLAVEEAVLLPIEAINAAWTRITTPDGKAWFSTNPSGPSAPFKTEWVDRIADYDGEVLDFLFTDNPGLPHSVAARLDSSLTGWRHDRLVKGLWVASSGAVYPHVAIHAGPHDLDKADITLGLDWATSGTLAVSLLRHDKRMTKGLLQHELRHVGREDGLLSASEAARKVAAWFEAVTGARLLRVPLIVDPSTPDEAKRAFAGFGFGVLFGDNDLVPGVMRTNNVLSEELLVVHERCRYTLESLRGLQYDEKAALIGEDKPAKDGNEHFADAVRYIVNTRWARAAVGHHEPQRAPVVSGLSRRSRPVVTLRR